MPEFLAGRYPSQWPGRFCQIAVRQIVGLSVRKKNVLADREFSYVGRTLKHCETWLIGRQSQNDWSFPDSIIDGALPAQAIPVMGFGYGPDLNVRL